MGIINNDLHDRINTILFSTLIIFLFVENKYLQLFFFDLFQIKLIYIPIVLIILNNFFFINFKTYLIFFLIFLIFGIYELFFVFNNSNTFPALLKQYIAISVLTFATIIIYRKNIFDNFFEKYTKLSIFFCKAGIIIFLLNIVVIMILGIYSKGNWIRVFNAFEFSYYIGGLQVYKSFFHQLNPINQFFFNFFFIDNFQLRAFSGEGNYFSFLVFPSLIYVISEKKYENRNFTLTIIYTALLLTFSLYAYLLILISALFKFKNIKFIIFIPILTLLIVLNDYRLFKKVYDTILYTPYVVMNNNFNEPTKEEQELVFFDLPELKELEKLDLNYLIKKDERNTQNFEEFLSKNKFFYLLSYYQVKLKRKADFDEFTYNFYKNNFIEYNMPGNQVNSSTLAVLQNLHVLNYSLRKNLLFGSGLGSYKKKKEEAIKSFYLPGAKIAKIMLNLSDLDGKLLIIRIFVENGIIILLIPTLLIILRMKANVIKITNPNVYIPVMFLLSKLFHNGSYIQMEIFLFAGMLIFHLNKKKNI